MQEDRRRLLERLRKEVGVGRIVRAMERVPRELFVPEGLTHRAYEDAPLPIGEGQTISQPYIVALMMSALELKETDTALEVGTGSGYQAAVLSLLVARVVTVERIASLADAARTRLHAMGCANVTVELAGAALGWPAAAPYDAIVVAAGAPRLPRELLDQLAVGGRMIVPVGSRESQELTKVTRTAESYTIMTRGPCRFVPLVGEGGWSEDELAAP